MIHSYNIPEFTIHLSMAWEMDFFTISGSLILFDLLRNQSDPNAPPEAETPKASPSPEVSFVQSREQTPVKEVGVIKKIATFTMQNS